MIEPSGCVTTMPWSGGMFSSAILFFSANSASLLTSLITARRSRFLYQ